MRLRQKPRRKWGMRLRLKPHAYLHQNQRGVQPTGRRSPSCPALSSAWKCHKLAHTSSPTHAETRRDSRVTLKTQLIMNPSTQTRRQRDSRIKPRKTRRIYQHRQNPNNKSTMPSNNLARPESKVAPHQTTEHLIPVMNLLLMTLMNSYDPD